MCIRNMFGFYAHMDDIPKGEEKKKTYIYLTASDLGYKQENVTLSCVVNSTEKYGF